MLFCSQPNYYYYSTTIRKVQGQPHVTQYTVLVVQQVDQTVFHTYSTSTRKMFLQRLSSYNGYCT
jgi:hypothetical protein